MLTNMPETELAASLTYTLGRLDREVQSNRQQGVLSPSEMAVLDDLARGPKTPGELAVLEHMTPASVTRHITALAHAGLLVRGTVADKRKATLELTRKGRAALADASQSSWLYQRISALDEEEREILRSALPVLVRLHSPAGAQNTQ